MKNINKIAPSLYAANLLDLNNELRQLEKNNVSYLHFDVMDGDFVPVISIGQLLLNQVQKNFNFKLDVHLMVNNNMNFINSMDLTNLECITLHFESKDFAQAYKYLKENNIKIGVAIKPQTSVDVLKPILNEVELILPMSVEPGKSGQAFIDISAKIKWLREQGFEKQIQVDGGINLQTLPICLNSGANYFVMGSCIFNNMANIKLAQNLIK